MSGPLDQRARQLGGNHPLYGEHDLYKACMVVDQGRYIKATHSGDIYFLCL